MVATLFCISLICALVGAVGSLVLGKAERVAKGFGCLFGAVAAILALCSGAMSILGPAQTAAFATPFSFASFSMLFNPLSGILLCVLSVLALVSWIYGVSYFDEYKGRGIGVLCFFMNLFIASMDILVVSDNGFWFLVFFEMMSLTSYFLVIFEQNKAAIKGGFMYLVMAHAGFMLIMIAFFIMFMQTGSFDFSVWRMHVFTPVTASIIFLLIFFGFGCKAGIIPLHSWLPQAHPAAPSNVSALMSGGMIKIGVFGIIKVGLDILAASGQEMWWGIIVVLIGAISSVLGVAYALQEHDIKKLLAYHSVENIGIILLGVGVAFIGVSVNQPAIAVLGLLAGLYHLINHAMFKGLLFLGAGSVLKATGTRNMNVLGGLAKAMPVTAMCFLIGSLAISAIPPLNGFVSEWFTYQSMITAAMSGDVLIKLILALAVVALAITGALAVACFVKAYGVTFLSTPRSKEAAEAKEQPFTMKLAMIILAAICVLLGVCAPLIVPVLQQAATSILAAPAGAPAAAGILLMNPDMGSIISTPLLTILLIAAILLPFAIKAILSSGGAAKDRDPWDCGYLPDAQMPPIASTFASTTDLFMHPVYAMRAKLVSSKGAFVRAFDKTVRGTDKAQSFGDKGLVAPVVRFVQWLANKSRAIEGGDFRIYLLYIVGALVVFLILIWIIH
ncbi:MAG: hydrogenase 4 subunit B [Coriobacteriales bacterium]|nr:hydrogenase 4 subunit B [Coriobacteriales bacterium]